MSAKFRVLGFLTAICMLPLGGIPALADETNETTQQTEAVEQEFNQEEMDKWEESLGDFSQRDVNAYTPTEAKNLIQSTDTGHTYDVDFDGDKEEESQEKTPEFVDGEILYAKTEGGISLFSANPDDALENLGISEPEKIYESTEKSDGKISLLSNTKKVWYKAKVSGDVQETVDKLKKVDGITEAEPNYIYHTSSEGLPEETERNFNWFMTNSLDKLGMSAFSGWNESYKRTNAAPGAGTVVAVIDTGVDYTHEDLAPSMWTNSGEIPGNGIDDDGNGYIDDYYGIDATANPKYDGKIAGDPMDNNGHGTHVSGIIAMAKNGKGGAGIAYGAKIMAIKAGQSTGSLANSDIVTAIKYAVSMGADVINMSFGGTSQSAILKEALEDAFPNCVLVAAAGNDGLPTTDAPPEFLKKEDIYPAGYSFVLGVMATDQNGDLTAFSNWDYKKDANAEYELAAPGQRVYSALPGNRYAYWNGTSMAAPCVSAAAAVLRACYPDENEYNSRFIMGQLASATESKTTYIDKTGFSHNYSRLNLYDSITKLPKPHLSVTETFALDNTDLSDKNDGDRIIDAGETIDLGIAIRNQWGKTGDISIKADAISDGGVANTYVEFIKDSIKLDPAGSFSETNNGFVWNDGELESVSNPIQLKISPDTPNDTQIKINLTVTTTNGMDKNDKNTYTTDEPVSFTFRVQKGQAISGHIKEDTTLTNDKYWILENALVIDEGATLTVEPGCSIQFWSQDYEDIYKTKSIVYINNKGTLNMCGTEEQPIEMFPGKGFENYVVQIYGAGVETLKYCKIINPYLGDASNNWDIDVDVCDHCFLVQNYSSIYHRFFNSGKIDESSYLSSNLSIRKLSNSGITNISHTYNVAVGINPKNNSTNLFQNCYLTDYDINTEKMWQNNTFIGNKPFVYTRAATIRNLQAIPDEKLPEFSEPLTYDGAQSKYVFMYPYDECGYDLAKAIAEQNGGTLACMNDETEDDFLYDALWKVSQKKREPDDDACHSIYAYIGYEFNKDTENVEWLDSPDNKYVPKHNNATVNYSNKYARISINSYQNHFSIGTFQSEYSKEWGSYYQILEFPATYSDEEIEKILNDVDVDYYLRNVANCAVLNPVLNTNPDTWVKFQAPEYKEGYYYSLARNYWGTENSSLINRMIIDDEDMPGVYGDIRENPILTKDDDLSAIYPFVTDIYLTDEGGEDKIEQAAPGKTYDVHVKFNRDMAQDSDPMVTYGGDEPYTDYSVQGAWRSAREWVGKTKISSVATGGTEIFRTKGAKAADDKWLECGTDKLRFSFEVNASSALSMVLNANGGINKIDLEWAQNDYETLGGYNLYRSEKPDSGFKKINNAILSDTVYTDTDVKPGVDYYYYFTVVDTNGNEIADTRSNTAQAAPLDNIKPEITHTPITTAKVGSDISVSAKATDNIKVTEVNLYYRTGGTNDYTKKTMTYNDLTKLYGATIPRAVVTADGVEYYIEAIDNSGNHQFSASATVPYKINTDDTPTILTVSPSVININSGAADASKLKIYGTNFKDGMTVNLGNQQIENYEINNEGTEITFDAPIMPIGKYAITIIDGERRVQKASAVTYRDLSSYVQINSGSVLAGEVLRLPLYVGSNSDLTAFYAEVKVPSDSFSSVSAEAADGVNASLSCNYSGGVLKISMAAAQNFKPESATSPIAYIVLSPKASDAEKAVQLTLTKGTLNGAETVTEPTDTAVTILPNFTLSANVTYYKNGIPVPGVKISAAGREAVTDDKGKTDVKRISRADVTVKAEKNEYSDAIDPHDAALILRSRVGLEELSALQRIAADVNGDGNVDEVDASLILKKTVKLIDTFDAGSWAFNPAYIKTNLRSVQSAVSFTAILIGDVDGSWNIQ